MKTVGVGHLSVPDKSYQDHCCYLTQYPPSNTHRQYYFRQLEHCVNIRGNIVCDTDFFYLIFTLFSPLLNSVLFFQPPQGQTWEGPFFCGIKTYNRKEMLWIPFCIEHTLSPWNNIWYLVTINFVLYDVNIVNIPLCPHRAELLTIVLLSPSLSLLSIVFMKHIRQRVSNPHQLSSHYPAWHHENYQWEQQLVKLKTNLFIISLILNAWQLLAVEVGSYQATTTG